MRGTGVAPAPVRERNAGPRRKTNGGKRKSDWTAGCRSSSASGDEQARRPAWWDLRSWKMVVVVGAGRCAGDRYPYCMGAADVPSRSGRNSQRRPAAPPAAAVEKPAPGVATLSAIKEPDPVVSQPPAAASVEASPAESQSSPRPRRLKRARSPSRNRLRRKPSPSLRLPPIGLSLPMCHRRTHPCAGPRDWLPRPARRPGDRAPPPDAAPGPARLRTHQCGHARVDSAKIDQPSNQRGL